MTKNIIVSSIRIFIFPQLLALFYMIFLTAAVVVWCCLVGGPLLRGVTGWGGQIHLSRPAHSESADFHSLCDGWIVPPTPHPLHPQGHVSHFCCLEYTVLVLYICTVVGVSGIPKQHIQYALFHLNLFSCLFCHLTNLVFIFYFLSRTLEILNGTVAICRINYRNRPPLHRQ